MKKSYGAKKDHEPDAVQSITEGNPSEVTHAAFIEAAYKGKKKMKPHTERVGKWLFFVAEKHIDDTWKNVKKAVEHGKLWRAAKSSTAWRSKEDGIYVVCVYTYDYDDEPDVMRIRAYLREMGFKRRVPYKSDTQTLTGEYSVNTDGIALYFA